MRAFTKIREWPATHRNLQEKIKKPEWKPARPASGFDKKFAAVSRVIRLLPDSPQKTIPDRGFEK